MSMLRRAAWMRWLPPIAVPVAVARDDDHVQVRAGHLDAGGERQGAAVRRVQRVDVDIARRARRAADARDHHHLVLVQPDMVDRAQRGLEDDAVPATGAEDRRKLVQAQILGHSRSSSVVPLRGPLDPFEDLARADRLAVNAHERIDRARPRGGPLDLVCHLPEVQLGDDDRPDLSRRTRAPRGRGTARACADAAARP